jgi:predicted lipid-binding transport protein (Tim44 family)
MHRTPRVLAAIAALAIALAPALAEARAGSGSSFGSRGSMTYSAPPSTNTAPSASPLQRSMTPNTPSPGYNSGMPGYGFGGRSPFMSGLMGGLVGAGLAGLLFGHGFWGGGLGFGGFLGFLLQIFLLVWLVRFVLRMIRGGPSPAFVSGPSMYARGPGGPPGPMPMGSGGGSAASSLAITPADYQAFEQNLQAIQAAWSVHDLNGLRALTTPEMASYFAEQLADQASRGVRNEVRDVALLQGDLAQAWSERGRDYATVAMRFSMIDVTRDATGRIVDGSATEHVSATELWTFVRTSGGGHWILSAIQQAR